MRLLHVSRYYWPATEWGGPAHSIPLLVKAIKERGIEVEVFTTNVRGAPGLPVVPAGRQLVCSVPVRYFSTFGPRRFSFAPALAAAMATHVGRFDVVHLHNLWSFPSLIGARVCEAWGVPYVVSPRGILDSWSLAQKANKKKLGMMLSVRRMLRRAAVIHYTAEDERERVPASFRNLPSVVIPNGIDLDHFLRVTAKEENNCPVHLIISGRIHPKKGFDLLVPAIAEVRHKGIDIDLTIAGPDERGYCENVQSMVIEYGIKNYVRFLGHLDTDDLVQEYQRANILVMPSYQENFGMSAAEAMAAERPVIISDAVNIAPAVEAAGAGLVVPLDGTALAQAIIALAKSPAARAAMGKRGRQYARDNYSPPAVAKKMVDLYLTIQNAHKCC